MHGVSWIDLVILAAVLFLVIYIIYSRKKDLEEIAERTKKEVKEHVEDVKRHIEDVKRSLK